METEKRKNLICRGNYKAIINDIIKFYEDTENHDVYEIYRNHTKIMDNDRLYKLFKNINENYAPKSVYEQMKTHNQELKMKNDRLENEAIVYRNRLCNFDRQIRKEEIIHQLEKENFEYGNRYSQIAIEKANLIQELKEKDKLIDKWKAMFTEQALANAKLINNGGTQCQKNTTDGN